MITTMSELKLMYNEMLDEYYDKYSIGGVAFYPSEILEELDPVAYRRGYLDYADSEGINIDDLENDL
ncbi:hypothetical protein Stuart_5 [Providencia phage vB_PstP_PS3]|uniref:Uncharacterized protein n=1 Tax=Providencia phage vB_PstP_PS3 TaxID=2848038 RepID=A0A411AWI3_9CAUD|nr:hypothetical protein HOV05_gp05 [Providencia phage vB_PstP_PS3]QAX92425.1 hypothetical protein Stuart_5 [Providencia phage vB_PstP_PS3]